MGPRQRKLNPKFCGCGWLQYPESRYQLYSVVEVSPHDRWDGWKNMNWSARLWRHGLDNIGKVDCIIRKGWIRVYRSSAWAARQDYDGFERATAAHAGYVRFPINWVPTVPDCKTDGDVHPWADVLDAFLPTSPHKKTGKQKIRLRRQKSNSWVVRSWNR